MSARKCADCGFYLPRRRECGLGGDVEPTDEACWQFCRKAKRRRDADAGNAEQDR